MLQRAGVPVAADQGTAGLRSLLNMLMQASHQGQHARHGMCSEEVKHSMKLPGEVATPARWEGCRS